MTEEHKYHAFLTHDWGTDQAGRDNHKRVVEIAKRLGTYGLKVWIDEAEMTGHIVMQMCSGIDDSKLVVVFVTKRYMEKLKLPNDNCASEFQYAQQTKGVQEMIAVVMEKEMADTRQWRGPLGMKLGGNLYVSMWDDDITTGVDNLVKEMAKRLPGFTLSQGNREPAKGGVDTAAADKEKGERIENERIQKEKAEQEKAQKAGQEKAEQEKTKGKSDEEQFKKEREEKDKERQKRVSQAQQERDAVRESKERGIREGFEKEKKKMINTHKKITSKLDGPDTSFTFEKESKAKEAELVAMLIIKNTALKKVTCAYNNLGDEGGSTLGLALGLTQSLTELSLGNCRLGPTAFGWIGDGLSKNKTLTTLYLGGNKVGDLGAQLLMDGLAKNNTLQQLDIRDIDLQSDGCLAIVDALAKNTSLTKLSLMHNPIEHKGALYLCEALSKNKTLKQLELNSTRAGDEGALALLKTLQTSNSTLESLVFAGSVLSNEVKLQLKEHKGAKINAGVD